jgi:hypothetical protein
LGELGLDSLTAIDVGVQLERLVPHRRDHFAIDPEWTLTVLIQTLQPPQSAPITSSTKTPPTKESKVVVTDDLEEKVVSTFRSVLGLSQVPYNKPVRSLKKKHFFQLF